MEYIRKNPSIYFLRKINKWFSFIIRDSDSSSSSTLTSKTSACHHFRTGPEKNNLLYQSSLNIFTQPVQGTRLSKNVGIQSVSETVSHHFSLHPTLFLQVSFCLLYKKVLASLFVLLKSKQWRGRIDSDLCSSNSLRTYHYGVQRMKVKVP